MPTVFESISDEFYIAFFEPEPDKRKREIEAWIKKATQEIQKATETELRSFIEPMLKDTWAMGGWKSLVQKFTQSQNDKLFIDAYKLCLDIKMKSSSTDTVVGTLSPEIRTKTIKAAEAAKTFLAKLEPPVPVTLREIDLHNNYRVEEAIPMLDKFLRESYRDNVRSVRIIHGKGIGVLRKAVREHLEKHKLVKSIIPVDKDHGGEGATEANLVDFNVNLL